MNELEEYFAYKCYKGLKERKLDGKPEYEERLKFEIKTILGMGFPGYFLIVHDFIAWARKNGIYVGPGRGSAAGSLVSYCLKITDLDPIRWDLMFERFLNPARISMPDIDIDFEKERRDEVIAYVRQKYGNNKVAHIGTFNLMRAKAAVRSVTKTLGHPYGIGDQLSKLVLPPIHGKPQPLQESIAKVPELNAFYNSQGIQSEILHWAEKVEDMVSSVGVHASGVVISNNTLADSVPLFVGKSGEVATQWEMGNIEEVGLIKFDFLGLDALTKIHRCIDIIKSRHGIDVDIGSIPLDDDKVFANLRSGDTVGIFQLESSGGIRDILIKMRPTEVEDLVALVAIYRPGPLESPEVSNYLAVKAGKSQPRFLVPELRPILGRTHGLLLYQEQCMQIATDLCGYTKSEADDLRKAIGKKKADLMAKHEVKFKAGWVKHGLPAAKGDELWTLMKGFAAYAFNRSHAAAYAFITYQTAWLKTHYPVEFLCAVMISEAGDQDDIIKCITECKRMGITVGPPDINTSHESFWVDNEKEIHFGLGPIKNLGEKPVSAIIEERKRGGPFKSFRDFCERVDLSLINRLKLDSLIKAGAFDSVGKTNRASMLAAVEATWNYRASMKSYASKMETYAKRYTAWEQREEDIRLYATYDKNHRPNKKPAPIKKPEEPVKPEWIDVPILKEMPESELQSNEYGLLGFYVSSHPLSKYEDTGLLQKFYKIEDIKEMPEKLQVNVAAVITNITEITAAKSKEKMAFLRLEDLTGSIEAVCFSKMYAEFKHLIIPGQPLRFDGAVQVTEADDGKVVKIRLNKISLLGSTEGAKEKPQKIQVVVKLSRANDLTELLQKYSGNVHEISIILEGNDGTKYKMPPLMINKDRYMFTKELARLTNG